MFGSFRSSIEGFCFGTREAVTRLWCEPRQVKFSDKMQKDNKKHLHGLFLRRTQLRDYTPENHVISYCKSFTIKINMTSCSCAKCFY